MTDQKLFKQVHEQVLDYIDDELISGCANWGYEISQTLSQHGLYIEQTKTEKSEQNSALMYAVATAVIIGQFAWRAFDDYFNAESTIDLDLLDIDFEEIRGFFNKDIKPKRLSLLKDNNKIGLQDIWIAMDEWKWGISKALVGIHTKQGEKVPADSIYGSLLDIYKDTNEEGYFYRAMTEIQKLRAYNYVNNGFYH